MISLDDYQYLAKRVEDMRRSHDKHRGALQEMARQAKEKFGVKTLAEAEALVKKWTKEEIALNEKYLKARKQLEKDHPELLEE